MAAVAAFVVLPEVRRIIDWHGNFDPLNTLSVIPLAMLCPVAVLAFRRRAQRRSAGFALVVTAWLAGFGYASVVAFAHGAFAPALHSIGEFCLPVTVGVWLLTCTESMAVLHARLARVLLVLGTIAATYGIAQYISAPPWDTAWMQNIGATSFGTPERFGIRVFGILNGPAVFALFLGCAIVFNLPYLRMRNTFHLLASLSMTTALMLSLFRTAWIGVALGITIFICLTPNRVAALMRVGMVAVVCICGALGAMLVSPDASAVEKIAVRFTTLSDVQDDYSLADRAATRDAALQKAVERPVGTGLGTTGASEKLANADADALNDVPDGPLDNGFIARFIEMGVVGFGAFLLGGLAAITLLVQTYARFARRHDRTGMLVTASCIATQVVIFLVNFSDDDLHGIFGILFFAALALPLVPSLDLVAEGKDGSEFIRNGVPRLRQQTASQ